MIPVLYQKLVDNLSVKSRKGEVNWIEVGDSSFKVKFTNYSLVFTQQDDGNYYFSIVSPKGNFVDGFEVEWDSDDAKAWTNELFEFARRRARNIDAAIKEIETDLARGGEVGLPPDGGDDTLPF